MAVKKEKLHAKGLEIAIYTEDFRDEYISLTDIAKYRNADDSRFIIQNWMRSRDVIEFLGFWELLHNPDFNRVNFEAVKNEAGYNRFVIKANAHGQYNTLNISDLGRGYCAANNPFILLIQNIFRCFRKVSEDVAELTKSVRSCQNSWTNGHFSHFICRLKCLSVPL